MEEKTGFTEANLDKITGEKIRFFNLGNKNNFNHMLDKNLIVKINNSLTFPGMFEKEKNGLLKLYQSGVRTPKVIFEKVRDSLAFLALEYIPNRSYGNWELFGEKLAILHSNKNEFFGTNSFEIILEEIIAMPANFLLRDWPNSNAIIPPWEKPMTKQSLISMFKSFVRRDIVLEIFLTFSFIKFLTF